MKGGETFESPESKGKTYASFEDFYREYFEICKGARCKIRIHGLAATDKDLVDRADAFIDANIHRINESHANLNIHHKAGGYRNPGSLPFDAFRLNYKNISNYKLEIIKE